MEIPAQFKAVFDILANHGFLLERHSWTSSQQRYYQGIISRENTFYHVKMVSLKGDDPDDYNPLGGLHRTVWAHNLIKKLRAVTHIQVDVPTIVSAPQELNYGPDVAWVVTEYNEEGPFVKELPLPGDTESDTYKNFLEGLKAAVLMWDELRQIEYSVISHFNVPASPLFAPYQALGKSGAALILAKRVGMKRAINTVLGTNADRYQKSLSAKSNLRLGLDAFELKNIFRPKDPFGPAQLVDTESFYWYPPYRMVAKMFIRLWANENRPDLGATFLRVLREESDIVPEELSAAILEKVVSGRWFDVLRRGQWATPAHAQRKKLIKILTRGQIHTLWE